MTHGGFMDSYVVNLRSPHTEDTHNKQDQMC